jgi:hypothetical protein
MASTVKASWSSLPAEGAVVQAAQSLAGHLLATCSANGGVQARAALSTTACPAPDAGGPAAVGQPGRLRSRLRAQIWDQSDAGDWRPASRVQARVGEADRRSRITMT